MLLMYHGFTTYFLVKLAQPSTLPMPDMPGAAAIALVNGEIILLHPCKTDSFCHSGGSVAMPKLVVALALPSVAKGLEIHRTPRHSRTRFVGLVASAIRYRRPTAFLLDMPCAVQV